MLHWEQQQCLWVNRQGESDNSSNKHQSQPSFPLQEEVKLEQVLTGDGGMRYYQPSPSLSYFLFFFRMVKMFSGEFNESLANITICNC